MILKQQIQVLLHINADNKKKNKIKILYEVFNWESVQRRKLLSCIKHLKMFLQA